MADHVADAIDALVPTDGPLIPQGDAPAPRDPTGAPLAAADSSASPPAADRSAEPDPTPEPSPSEGAAPAAAEETLDLDALLGKLSPEQKAGLLKRFDTDELFRLDERLSGRLGVLAQKQAREIVEGQARQAQQQAVRDARTQALRDRDPDKALEVLQHIDSGEDAAAHAASWEAATGVFHALDADPLTKPLVAHLGGRDYGKLAGGDGTAENPGNGHFAALLYKADLADAVVTRLSEVITQVRDQTRAEIDAAWEKRVKDEIEPAVERRVRAAVTSGTPGPITGSSTGPGGQTDTDFLLAYGRGETHDHRRARQLTGISN